MKSNVFDGWVTQEFHLVRNNTYFELDKLLKREFTNANPLISIVYSVGLPLSTAFADPVDSTQTVQQYENIFFAKSTSSGPTNEKIFKIRSNVYPTSGMTDHKVHSFILKVTVTYSPTSGSGFTVTDSIRIYIHDRIERAWASPNLLTVRENMDNIMFNIHAKFSGDIIADITNIPNVVYTAKTNFPNILAIAPGSTDPSPYVSNHPNDFTRIVKHSSNTWSIPNPRSISNCVTITLPAYLDGLSTDAGVYVGDIGMLEPITTDAEARLNNSINTLFITDGFTDTAEAREFVKQAVAQISSDVGRPWNLIRNINFWLYNAQSREAGGSMRDYFMELDDKLHASSNTNTRIASVNSYIELSDKIVNRIGFAKPGTNDYTWEVGDFTSVFHHYDDILKYMPFVSEGLISNWSNFTQKFPLVAGVPDINVTPRRKFLKLSDLIALVGFPSEDDKNKLFGTKKAEWNALGWITTAPTNVPSEPQPIIIQYQGDSGIATSHYFLEFTYKLWLKLTKRMVVDKFDTAFDTYREVLYEDATLNVANTKLKDKKSLNKLINSLKYIKNSTTYNVGEKFFDSDGYPIFSDYEDVNQQGKPFRHVLNGNNIIFLSKVPRYRTGGVNIPIAGDKVIGATKVFFTERYSVIPLHNEASYIFNSVESSNFTANGVRTNIYKPTLSVVDKLHVFAKNAIVHEWGHNFLVDEYNAGHNLDYDVQSTDAKNNIDANLSFTNLQSSGTIKSGNSWVASNIRWYKWPRILGVAVSSDILSKSNNILTFKFERSNGTFVNGQKVLLRRNKLYTAEYYKCTVTGVAASEITMTLDSGAIDESKFTKGSLLIIPKWNDTNDDYERLIHKNVKTIINNSGPLIELDKYDPLDPDKGGKNRQSSSKISNKIKDKHLVVGLYAGGTLGEGTANNTGYEKNIFHPTGYCVMRETDDNTPNGYCHVCQYIIVDEVDPTLHPVIDVEYFKSIYDKLTNL